jgi:hypothetical protein
MIMNASHKLPQRNLTVPGKAYLSNIVIGHHYWTL